MNKKILLSAVVSVFNGEKELDDCLKSLAFASEIIVVDNSSTDKTMEIARKYTDKIFTRPNNPMLNVNKNYGFSKANEEWILYLDMDERVTAELASEIKSEIRSFDKLRTKSETTGYWIPRKNIIFGKWIEHTGWYPDHQLRLFKNGKGTFPEKHVHEMIKLSGQTLHLKNNLLHYNYTTVSQFINKLNIYVANEAEQLLKNGYEFKWQDSIRFPIKEFLSRFFAREGYRDGLHGLVLSLLMAFYHLLVFSTIWEKRGFERIEDNNFINNVDKELKKSYKDIFFWIDNEKMKLAKNPLRKILHRVISKIRTR